MYKKKHKAFALESHFKLMVDVQKSSKCNKTFNFRIYRVCEDHFKKPEHKSYTTIFFPTCRS